jgi:hypothetical protein
MAFESRHELLTSDFNRAFKVVDKCVQRRVVEDRGPCTNSKASLAGTARFGKFGRGDIYPKLILEKNLEMFCVYVVSSTAYGIVSYGCAFVGVHALGLSPTSCIRRSPS